MKTTIFSHCLVLFIFASTFSRAFPENNRTLLVISPSGSIYEQVLTGLSSELEGSLIIERIVFDTSLTIAHLDHKITTFSPRVILTMGNKPIKLYKEYLDSFKNNKNDIPLVTLLASQMEKSIEGIGNVQGISYETPMVTALVNFRSIFGKPVTKVGIVYRSIFDSFIKQHTEFCKREKIEVIAILVGNDPKNHKKEIEKSLHQLIKKEHVDLLWIPNDNILLRPELLGETWIPLFTKNPVPAIVGVEGLVTPELNFGTFAVIPEPQAMGEQAAQLIAKIEDTDWKFESVKIYPAISVYSVLNLKKASAFIDARNLNTNEVTRILREQK